MYVHIRWHDDESSIINWFNVDIDSAWHSLKNSAESRWYAEVEKHLKPRESIIYASAWQMLENSAEYIWYAKVEKHLTPGESMIYEANGERKETWCVYHAPWTSKPDRRGTIGEVHNGVGKGVFITASEVQGLDYNTNPIEYWFFHFPSKTSSTIIGFFDIRLVLKHDNRASSNISLNKYGHIKVDNNSLEELRLF